MDRRAWWATVREVTERQVTKNNVEFLFQIDKYC